MSLYKTYIRQTDIFAPIVSAYEDSTAIQQFAPGDNQALYCGNILILISKYSLLKIKQYWKYNDGRGSVYYRIVTSTIYYVDNCVIFYGKINNKKNYNLILIPAIGRVLPQSSCMLQNESISTKITNRKKILKLSL